MNTYKNRWLVFISTAIMVTLANLDMTIVNLALPKMANVFHASLNQAQWVISAYFIAASLMFAIFGKVADIIGRKKVFIIGVILFTSGSLFASLAHHMPVLIAMRFIQGLGYAASFSLTFVIAAEHFPQQQRNFITGLLVITTGIGQSLGPIAGGIIIQYFNWHMIFLVNVPFGIISIILAIFYINKDKLDAKKNKLNLLNAALFVIGLGLVLTTTNQMSQISTSLASTLIVIGLLVLVFFLYISFKQKNTLINSELLRHKNFNLILISRFLFMMFFGGGLFILPIYIQNILKFSTLDTGLIMLAMTAVIASVSPNTGKLLKIFSYQSLIKISLLFAVITLTLLLFNGAQVNFITLFAALVVFGIAIGIHLPITIVGTRFVSNEENAATAMGLLFTATFSGAAIGVGIAGGLIHYISQRSLSAVLHHQHFSSTLLAAAHGSKSVLTLPNPQLQHIAAIAFTHSLHAVAVTFLFTNLLGLSLLLYCWKKHSKKSNAATSHC